MLVMIAAVALGLSMVSAAQQTAESVSAVGTASNQSTILVTTIVGFLSLLATQGFAMWREARNRKWDLEDRKAARAEMRQSMQVQQIETLSTATELAKQAIVHRQHLTEQIAENTQLTAKGVQKAEAAYEVGNNLDQRLDELRKELDKLIGKRGQIDHIEEVSEDTNVKVTELKEGTGA